MTQKQLTNEQFDHIETCFNNTDGEDIMSYSGRAMYGAQCLALTFEGFSDAFNFALEIGSYEGLAELLASPSYDSMGRGIVIYFRNIAVPSEVLAREAKEDEDEDEFV